MWMPVLRALIQGYMGFTLTGILLIKHFGDNKVVVDSINLVLTLIAFLAPITITIFMIKNKSKFDLDEFKQKYETLYLGQRTFSKIDSIHYMQTPLFFWT